MKTSTNNATINREIILQKVIPCLRPQRENPSDTDEVAFVYRDLEVYFRVFFTQSSSTILTKSALEDFEIDISDLIDRAESNLRSQLEIKPLGEMISDLGVEEPVDEPCDVYCVTSRNHIYGAGAMMCLEELPEIQNVFGSHYTVIPSSVHEILCISSDALPVEDLNNMVYQVNRTCVTQEDYLSNHVYCY